MRKIYETAVILIGTLSWWGFVYPELCLTEDAYEQEAETEEITSGQCTEGTGQDVTQKQQNMKESFKENSFKEDSFWEVGVNVGEFRIKSRAAEYVYQVNEEK